MNIIKNKVLILNYGSYITEVSSWEDNEQVSNLRYNILIVLQREWAYLPLSRMQEIQNITEREL
jgi:hypothetical protein